MDKIHLTIPQQRALYASLRFFEKSLRTSDELLSNGNITGTLYALRSRLSAERRRAIRERIQNALEETKAFSDMLNFGLTEDSIEGIIMADMSVCWENLEECRAKHLRGYGEVDPPTGAAIDLVINKLSSLALEISHLVSSPEGPGERHDPQDLGKKERENEPTQKLDS